MHTPLKYPDMRQMIFDGVESILLVRTIAESEVVDRYEGWAAHNLHFAVSELIEGNYFTNPLDGVGVVYYTREEAQFVCDLGQVFEVVVKDSGLLRGRDFVGFCLKHPRWREVEQAACKVFDAFHKNGYVAFEQSAKVPAQEPPMSITSSPQLSSHAPSKHARIAGWILSILPCGLLIFSGIMKLIATGPELEGFTRVGWPAKLALPLGILELTCVILYLIPRTAILGAILLTGYMGGAIATHVRIEEPFIAQTAVGVFLWGGLFLRYPALRQMLPVMKG